MTSTKQLEKKRENHATYLSSVDKQILQVVMVILVIQSSPYGYLVAQNLGSLYCLALVFPKNK